jgi:hypothetical protein
MRINITFCVGSPCEACCRLASIKYVMSECVLQKLSMLDVKRNQVNSRQSLHCLVRGPSECSVYCTRRGRPLNVSNKYSETSL